MIAIPALISVAVVIINPEGLFLGINDRMPSFKQLQHGPLYWIMISQLVLYVIASFIVMFKSLRERTRIGSAYS